MQSADGCSSFISCSHDVTALVVDSTGTTYFYIGGPVPDPAVAEGIYRLADDTLTFVAPGRAGEGTALLVDGNTFFYVGDGVWRVNGDGSGEQQLASGYGASLVATSDTLYWLASDDNGHQSVRSVPRVGGPTTILGSEPTRIGGIALGGGHLYWSTTADGNLVLRDFDLGSQSVATHVVTTAQGSAGPLTSTTDGHLLTVETVDASLWSVDLATFVSTRIAAPALAGSGLC